MEMLRVRVCDPSRVTIISDHYTLSASAKQAEIVKFTREWAAANGIEHYYEFAGPCHQIMVEKGRVSPGEIVVGIDSHTCMYGALGAFFIGIGSTEMLGVLVTGEIWFEVLQTMRVHFDGILPEGVMAKDVALRTIGTIGHNGATYRALEFCGSTFDAMPMDERLCVTNMAVEAGAKNEIIACDDITRAYLREHNISDGTEFRSDKDAAFFAEYRFNAAQLEPLCACPHEVDNVTEISRIGEIPIHQAYIGSCTGGCYHDLKVAADLLKGKRLPRASAY